MSRARLINLAEPPGRRTPSARLRDALGDKFRVANVGGTGAAEIFVYDEIGYFGISAGDFVTAVRALGAQPIDLHINSYGGDVWDGMAIYNAVQQHPAEVTVYVDGIAASAASFIAMAGDRLVMAKNSNLMIHDALCLTFGNEADHRDGADLLSMISDQIAGIYADKSGTDEAGWRASMRTEAWYTGAEAVAAGLADELAEPRASTSKPADAVYPSIFAFAGRDKAPAPTMSTRAPELAIEAPIAAKVPVADATSSADVTSESVPTSATSEDAALVANVTEAPVAAGSEPTPVAAVATPDASPDPAPGAEAVVEPVPTAVSAPVAATPEHVPVFVWDAVQVLAALQALKPSKEAVAS